MTKAQNPEKKHRRLKKAKKKLEMRIKMYENAITKGNSSAFTKPGSMKIR